ncbi:hypothetical protein NPIL_539881 [Nephila pilipes]|uniref:Uncharacterized protein n=1 Tax=Nephila pilipes TaxID=299642 RepID=A0A8X6PXZ5_NEPPI|nr:hypothetical protein NPIL_539881 [Nephila pilipes]
MVTNLAIRQPSLKPQIYDLPCCHMLMRRRKSFASTPTVTSHASPGSGDSQSQGQGHTSVRNLRSLV